MDTYSSAAHSGKCHRILKEFIFKGASESPVVQHLTQSNSVTADF